MSPSLKTILDGGRGVGNKYIQDWSELERMVKLLKESGYDVVLTQGVYDMFHVGHSRYLDDAREFGNILIVGVDSDELTRQMKGEGRPFDTFEDRVELLAALASVNIITRRDVGEHMHDLIKLVHPDVLVMSLTTTSFTEEDKEALEQHCGKIEHLEARAATSTTAKLRRLKIDGAKGLAERIIKVLKEHLEGDSDG